MTDQAAVEELRHALLGSGQSPQMADEIAEAIDAAGFEIRQKAMHAEGAMQAMLAASRALDRERREQHGPAACSWLRGAASHVLADLLRHLGDQGWEVRPADVQANSKDPQALGDQGLSVGMVRGWLEEMDEAYEARDGGATWIEVLNDLDARLDSLPSEETEPTQETVTQWRVWRENGDPESVGHLWRDEKPTDEELAEWREEFICPIWIETRTVTYSQPVRVEVEGEETTG